MTAYSSIIISVPRDAESNAKCVVFAENPCLVIFGAFECVLSIFHCCAIFIKYLGHRGIRFSSQVLNINWELLIIWSVSRYVDKNWQHNFVFTMRIFILKSDIILTSRKLLMIMWLCLYSCKRKQSYYNIRYRYLLTNEVLK